MQRSWLYHACRVAKFQGVHCLDMLFPESLGADQLQVFFVGLKGERTQVRCAQPAALLCIPCQPITGREQICTRCVLPCVCRGQDAKYVGLFAEETGGSDRCVRVEAYG